MLFIGVKDLNVPIRALVTLIGFLEVWLDESPEGAKESKPGRKPWVKRWRVAPSALPKAVTSAQPGGCVLIDRRNQLE